ncbi:AGAP012565-PA, partial [Gryllus bimaculatus]
VIFIFSLLGYEEMLTDRSLYPQWSISVGWALTASSLLCIPVYAVYKIAITPGPFLKRLSKVMKPEDTSEERSLNANSTCVPGAHV